MTNADPKKPVLELISEVPTDEGVLTVRALEDHGRWVVRARCAAWYGIGLADDLAAAATAALGPYASGIALDRDAGHE